MCPHCLGKTKDTRIPQKSKTFFLILLFGRPPQIRWTRKTTTHEQTTSTYQQLRGLVLNVWAPSTCKVLKQVFSRTLENTHPYNVLFWMKKRGAGNETETSNIDLVVWKSRCLFRQKSESLSLFHWPSGQNAWAYVSILTEGLRKRTVGQTHSKNYIYWIPTLVVLQNLFPRAATHNLTVGQDKTLTQIIVALQWTRRKSSPSQPAKQGTIKQYHQRILNNNCTKYYQTIPDSFLLLQHHDAPTLMALQKFIGP